MKTFLMKDHTNNTITCGILFTGQTMDLLVVTPQLVCKSIITNFHDEEGNEWKLLKFDNEYVGSSGVICILCIYERLDHKKRIIFETGGID